MNNHYAGFPEIKYFKEFLKEKGMRYKDIHAELALLSFSYEKEIRELYHYHGFCPNKYVRDVRKREAEEFKKICKWDKDYKYS